MDFWQIQEGTEIGVAGKRILISKEQLKRHTIIIGKTGTGKSYLLTNLIENIRGSRRLIVFDLHGELWKYSNEDSYIIALRPYIDSKEAYLKFNLMGVLPYRNSYEKMLNEDLTIKSLKDIFSREEVYSHGTWGPRIELIFTLLPKLLLKYRANPTIEDMLEILLDPYARRDFLSELEETDKMKYYSIFNSQGYDYISSSVNKLMPLLSSEISKNAFSSKYDSLDFSKLDKDLYIVLSAEYSSPLIVKQFSIMLLYKIWNNLLINRLKDVGLVIDEFQILTPSIAEIFLTEGRKFGLNLIAATQTTSSLGQKINEILRTNVSNIIAFKGSEIDFYNLTKEELWLNQEHQFLWADVFSSMHFRGSLRYFSRKERNFELSKEFYDYDTELKFDERSWKDPYYLHILSTLNLVSLEGNKIVPNEEYMKLLGSRKVKGRESLYHRYLITRAYLFFKSQGLNAYENILMGDGQPDLVVRINGKYFPVECEYSDIKKPERIQDKKSRYKDVIFVTFRGYESKLPQDSKIIIIPPIGEESEIKTINFQIN
ncbi:MAG: type IV secretion system DNA-binding domain-containing protein [Thermoplasmatales archaeon]